MAPESRPNPDVATGLGGLEPAWTMLDRASLVGLMDEPSAENRALRLANDLTGDELTLSPVARIALVLLRATVESGGLNMTAADNLSRATVSAMQAAMTWPDHDPADARRCRKVLNEADYGAASVNAGTAGASAPASRLRPQASYSGTRPRRA